MAPGFQRFLIYCISKWLGPSEVNGFLFSVMPEDNAGCSLTYKVLKPEGEDTRVPGMTKVRASQSICQSSTKWWTKSQLDEGLSSVSVMFATRADGLGLWPNLQLSPEFFKGDWPTTSKVTLSSKMH